MGTDVSVLTWQGTPRTGTLRIGAPRVERAGGKARLVADLAIPASPIPLWAVVA